PPPPTSTLFPTRRSSDLSLARDLAAAIGYAREGFPVTGRLARAIELHAADGSLNASALAVFAPKGAAPRAGGVLSNRGLAFSERSEEHTSELQSRRDLVC